MLDRKGRPLMPCTEKRARKLLEQGRAVVVRLEPFVIRLKDRAAEEASLQPLRLKIDPGYKVTGISVVRVAEGKEAVVFFAEVHHRTRLSEKLLSRRRARRSRRSRKTRYRAPRFSNRRRPEGWLAPSAEARVNQVLSVIKKLVQRLPVTEIVVESAKFDTQKLQNPEVSGIEYQRGELFGYEVREYLLEKFGRRCAYCGRGGVPLGVDHMVPKSKHGTDRVSNLTLACRECNQAKGNRLPQEWLGELKKSRRAADRRRAENIPEVLSQLTRGHRSRGKVRFGFATGDLVVVEVPAGKYAGRYIGYVAVRQSGYFDLKDLSGRRVCQGVSWCCFRLLQRFDGWRYEKFKVAALSSPHLKVGASSAV